MSELYHRLFIGCDFSDTFKKNIEIVIDKLEKKLIKKCELNWAILNKIHFTLRFLGNIEENQIDKIHHAVEQTLKNHPPLKLILKNISFFPKNRPHVLAINLRLTEELAKLYADVNKALETCEIAKETRVFLPHITLARVHEVEIKEENFEQEFRLLPQEILIDKVYLFKSNPQNREEEYKKLNIFYLSH